MNVYSFMVEIEKRLHNDTTFEFSQLRDFNFMDWADSSFNLPVLQSKSVKLKRIIMLLVGCLLLLCMFQTFVKNSFVSKKTS